MTASLTDGIKQGENKRLAQFGSSPSGPVLNWVSGGLERFQGNYPVRIEPPTARRRETKTESAPVRSREGKRKERWM